MGAAAEIERVLEHQRTWAHRTGRELGSAGDRLLRVEEATFGGALDSATHAELAAGAGGELARLTSLRSSSALAVNVFRPWRQTPGGAAAALNGSAEASALRFEAVFPTGLRGTPPHLDVVIDEPDRLLAIESKFLEPYDGATNAFRPSYFAHGALWEELPACRRLAERIATGHTTFRWLSAAQLLKHALGLTRSGGRFRLLMLWYRIDGPIADQLEEEIGLFGEAVAPDVDFEAVTYQQLFDRLAGLPDPEPGYRDYLAERYFTP